MEKEKFKPEDFKNFRRVIWKNIYVQLLLIEIGIDMTKGVEPISRRARLEAKRLFKPIYNLFSIVKT